MRATISAAANSPASGGAPSLSALDWAMLILLAALWGGTFLFVELALAAFPPFTLVALRVGFGAATLWIIALLLGLAPPKGLRLWSRLLLLGFLNNAVPFSLIVYGQTQIGAGLASILNAATPVFTVLVAGALLPDERIRWSKGAGALVGLAGAALVIGPKALLELGAAGFQAPQTLAQLAVLGAALSYAFAAIQARRLSRTGLSPLMIAVGQLTASTLLLVPAALLVDQPFSAEQTARYAALPSADLALAWAASIAQGVASTAFAYLLYFRIIASAGATNGALVTLLIPPFAILFGVALLGERLAAQDILGMAVIGLGLALIDGRLLRRR